jgi:excisionase family DNA binding protein
LKTQNFKSKRWISNPSGVIPKRLYSIKEAWVYLGRSVCALREMIWAGKLPYIRDGRRILLDIHDMNLWVEKSKTRFED